LFGGASSKRPQKLEIDQAFVQEFPLANRRAIAGSAT
jgi:hypothetical protein